MRLGISVTVARLTLDQLVKVQILHPQFLNSRCPIAMVAVLLRGPGGGGNGDSVSHRACDLSSTGGLWLNRDERIHVAALETAVRR